MTSLHPAHHNQDTAVLSEFFFFHAWLLYPGQSEGSVGQSVHRVFYKMSLWGNQFCLCLWARTGVSLGSRRGVHSLSTLCFSCAPSLAIAPFSEEAKTRCCWAADAHQLHHGPWSRALAGAGAAHGKQLVLSNPRPEYPPNFQQIVV